MHYMLFGCLLPFKVLQDASKLASESQKVAGRWGGAPDPAGGLPSSRPPGLAPPLLNPKYATVHACAEKVLRQPIATKICT